MFTVEELNRFNDLTLHSLLIDAVSLTVDKMRALPTDKIPSDEQGKEIAKMEIYVMEITKILIARDAFPREWWG